MRVRSSTPLKNNSSKSPIAVSIRNFEICDWGRLILPKLFFNNKLGWLPQTTTDHYFFDGHNKFYFIMLTEKFLVSTIRVQRNILCASDLTSVGSDFPLYASFV